MPLKFRYALISLKRKTIDPPAFKNINTQKRKQKPWKISTVKKLNEKEAGNPKVNHDVIHVCCV